MIFVRMPRNNAHYCYDTRFLALFKNQDNEKYFYSY